MGKVMRHTLGARSEERFSRNAETDLVCRLLLEKKKTLHKGHTHVLLVLYFSLFTSPATTGTYALSLHDALPISRRNGERRRAPTASISKESPAITGVVEMVIRRPI